MLIQLDEEAFCSSIAGFADLVRPERALSHIQTSVCCVFATLTAWTPSRCRPKRRMATAFSASVRGSVRLGLRSHCRTARPQCLPHWKSGHSTICLTSAQRFRRVPSTLTKCIRHPFSHFFLLSHSLYSPLCSPCSPHLHIYSSSLQRSNLRRTPGIRTSGLRISGPRMLSR